MFVTPGTCPKLSFINCKTVSGTPQEPVSMPVIRKLTPIVISCVNIDIVRVGSPWWDQAHDHRYPVPCDNPHHPHTEPGYTQSGEFHYNNLVGHFISPVFGTIWFSYLLLVGGISIIPPIICMIWSTLLWKPSLNMDNYSNWLFWWILMMFYADATFYILLYL